jgi:hypothetical protein
VSCFVINSGFNPYFVREVARYGRQVGVGHRNMCFWYLAGTPTKLTCAAEHGERPGFVTRLESRGRFP